MAARKKPETNPVLDNSGKGTDTSLVQYVLPERHYNSVIRVVRRTEKQSVINQLGQAARDNLERVGKKPDAGKRVKRTPKNASDQVDVQSIIVWMGKLTKGTKRANAQLIAIEATCSSRGG
jgi:hypothetical protein